MKYRLKHYLFLIILFPAFLAAQNTIKLTIIVNTAGLSDSEIVYISGNLPELGQWHPNIISLEKKDSETWIKTLIVPLASELQFKFTLGEWDREALTDSGGIPQNNYITVLNDTILNFYISRWKITETKKFIGQITGEVKYHKEFPGKNIRPRDIIVWLPHDYNDDTIRYPVLYMQDGQNIFDPATSSFGIDWQADETADSLIRNNLIFPIIIVGIYNTPARSSEYTPNDTGRAYMKFIVDELKPFIDKNYRTLPDRNNTSVAGSSAGGLISFMLAWEYPEIFSKAACISPAYKIGWIDFVSPVKSYEGEKKPLLFYIDNGGIGIEEKLQPGIDAMISTLQEKGYKENKDYLWKKFTNDEHSEAFWAKRFHIPLQFFFGMN